MAKIVATTLLPVDRLTATDCNADARAKKKHSVIMPELVVPPGKLSKKNFAKIYLTPYYYY